MPIPIDRITAIVRETGKLGGLGPDDDFYDAGFSSIHSLSLLLELEDACGVAIPDDEFIGARSVRALHAMIGRLGRESAA